MPMEKQKQRRINWHHAACEVLKIELEEYEEYLDFYEEYHLGTSKDSLRIDVLIIQKKQNYISQRKLRKNLKNIIS